MVQPSHAPFVPASPTPEAPLRKFSLVGCRPWLAAGLLLALAVAAHAAPSARAAAKPATKSAANPPANAPQSVSVGLPTQGDRKALVIEGDDHLFMVAAPQGWVLDDTSGMGSRIRCVFYPKGQKWANAPTVMYVNPLHGYTARIRTVSALINDDVSKFMKRAPKGRVIDAGKITTASKKQGIVRHFSDDGGPPQEAVAYIPEKDLVMLVVLSSRTPQGFRAALPAYEQLISTYAWVGTNKEYGR